MPLKRHLLFLSHLSSDGQKGFICIQWIIIRSNMKKKLLTLFAAGAMGLPMCAAFYMCVKLNSSDIIKFEVENIEEVTYSDNTPSPNDSFMKIKLSNGDSIKYNTKEIAEVYYEKIIEDTTAVGDTTIIDAESTPLTFKVLNDSTVEISGYLKKYFVDEDGVIEMKEIKIPANVSLDSVAYSVVGIGDGAFSSCIGLSAIEIPSTVTYIGDKAFNSCKGLKSIELSSNLNSIGEEAFQNCTGLTNILIPSSVTDIKEWAFYGCTNLDVVIDNSKDKVAVGAEGFTSCKSVTFAKGDYAAVDDTETNFIFKVLNDSTAEVAKPKSANIEEAIVPPLVKINGKEYSVVSIGNSAFLVADGQSLKSITLPSSIKDIKDEAFEATDIQSIEFPENLETIGNKAFANCKNLTAVEIPAKVAKIGDGAFIGCSQLATITVDSKNPSYLSAEGVLYNKTQTELIRVPAAFQQGYVIPSNVVSIKSYAFSECLNLTSITVPSTVSSIEDYAFSGCANLDITIDNYEDSIKVGKNAFENCKSVTFKMPEPIKNDSTLSDSITHLNYRVISDVAAEITGGCTSAISIPDSIEIGEKLYAVTRIAEDAFVHCDSLTNVKIPSSIKNIGGSAFMDCKNLASVEIPSSITIISDSLFKDCDSLKSVKIPESVKYIGDAAFENCKMLDLVIDNYEDSLTYGDVALRDCKSVTYTKVDPSIVNASDSPLAFKITSDSTAVIAVCDANNVYGAITVPEKVRIDHKVYTVTSISKGAFQQCIRVTSVTLPETITTIEENAFNFCRALASINLPSSLTSIGESAFIDCTNLKNITIPSGVLKIDAMAFAYCSNLNVTINNIAENIAIGNNAFYGIKSVKYAEE